MKEKEVMRKKLIVITAAVITVATGAIIMTSNQSSEPNDSGKQANVVAVEPTKEPEKPVENAPETSPEVAPRPVAQKTTTSAVETPKAKARVQEQPAKTDWRPYVLRGAVPEADADYAVEMLFDDNGWNPVGWREANRSPRPTEADGSTELAIVRAQIYVKRNYITWATAHEYFEKTGRW